MLLNLQELAWVDARFIGHRLFLITPKTMCSFQMKGPLVFAAGIHEQRNEEIFFPWGIIALFAALSIRRRILGLWLAVMTTELGFGTEDQPPIETAVLKRFAQILFHFLLQISLFFIMIYLRSLKMDHL